jgi:hypothetical protein
MLCTYLACFIVAGEGDYGGREADPVELLDISVQPGVDPILTGAVVNRSIYQYTLLGCHALPILLFHKYECRCLLT